MKLAIMQPYVFPYIGYFQLIKAVDKFVFYDDVNFIKQGWVNRNRILMNGKDHMFSIPLEKQSSFTKIADTRINQSQYGIWKKKFYRTLTQAYKKAPFFDQVYPTIESVLESKAESIAEIAKNSVRKSCEYMDLNVQWVSSSSIYANEQLTSQERVLDICKKETADVYINPIGGMNLYSLHDFEKYRIGLNFLRSKEVHYQQHGLPFVPWLSIIDVLMFNTVENIRAYLDKYELL